MGKHTFTEKAANPSMFGLEGISSVPSTIPSIFEMEGITSVPVPGRRCPACLERGDTVWVVPGKCCAQCGTPVN